ncbi:MAG: hypothetical protein GNW80_14155 [Asgard group archaeon]|nr:hypothetical protein [Asgard group archaeon]
MPKTEYDNVKKTMEIYIEGSRRLDYDTMISVVHPDARLFLSEKQTYYKKTTIEILSIEVEGKIASVKLNYNNWYYDFHNLIKIGSDWKIVDKVSHKIE